MTNAVSGPLWIDRGSSSTPATGTSRDGVCTHQFPEPLDPDPEAGVEAGGAAVAAGAGRIRTAVRGKVKEPPASSMTLIWQM